MVKRGMILLVVGAVTILGACGSQDEGPEPTVTRIPDAANAPGTPAESPAPSPAGSPAGSPVGSPEPSPVASPPAPPAEIRIALKDIFFDPKEITIPANTDVTVSLVNEGAAVHTFDIDALNVHSGDVQPGATATVTINAPAGDYEFYCAIPGHKEAGMVGTLHVVEGGAPPPAASPQATAVPTEAATPAAQTGAPIELALEDIKFNPTELTIPANTPVTINLTNNGAAAHAFDVDALNIHSGEIPAGGTGSVTINAPAGDYEFYCSVPGHKEAGMVGTLHVVESGAPPAASPAASPVTSPVASPTGSPVALAGDVERGKSQVAVCLACHSVDGSTQVGPTWQGLYGKTETLTDGSTVVVDDAYLHESIVDPNAKVVEGFQPGVMPPFTYLTDQQIADIIAYIKSLQE